MKPAAVVAVTLALCVAGAAETVTTGGHQVSYHIPGAWLAILPDTSNLNIMARPEVPGMIRNRIAAAGGAEPVLDFAQGGARTAARARKRAHYEAVPSR